MKRRIACAVAVAFTPKAQADQQVLQAREGRPSTNVATLLEQAHLRQVCEGKHESSNDFDFGACDSLVASAVVENRAGEESAEEKSEVQALV